MNKITVLPQNKVIESADGANLRELLISEGLQVKSPCGGCASCGQCVVTIAMGSENLNDIPFEEKQLLGNVFHITNERLSCQTTVQGDITVDISAHDQLNKKPVITKRRTQSEVEQIKEERKEKRALRPEKEGGKKRPKSFKV